jgi:hypothetical protein
MQAVGTLSLQDVPTYLQTLFSIATTRRRSFVRFPEEEEEAELILDVGNILREMGSEYGKIDGVEVLESR